MSPTGQWEQLASPQCCRVKFRGAAACPAAWGRRRETHVPLFLVPDENLPIPTPASPPIHLERRESRAQARSAPPVRADFARRARGAIGPRVIWFGPSFGAFLLPSGVLAWDSWLGSHLLARVLHCEACHLLRPFTGLNPQPLSRTALGAVEAERSGRF